MPTHNPLTWEMSNTHGVVEQPDGSLVIIGDERLRGPVEIRVSREDRRMLAAFFVDALPKWRQEDGDE